MNQMCMVNELGEMLEILPFDREPLEGEFKVPLGGYYEVFNEQHYPQAIYDFTTNAWVGVGEPIPVPTPEITLAIEERTRLLEEVVNAFMEGGL